METKSQFITEKEKTWAMIVHLSTFSLFIVPAIGAILVPLVIWILKKPDMPFVDYHGKEVLNFNITVLLFSVVAGILCFALIGFLFLPIIFLYWFIFVIIAAIKANEGQYFKYPMTIRFIK